MMFALLQGQHQTQMDAMAALNQKVMEAMFDKMNTIIANNCKTTDKENNPLVSNNSGTTTAEQNGTAKDAPTAESWSSTSQQPA